MKVGSASEADIYFIFLSFVVYTRSYLHSPCSNMTVYKFICNHTRYAGVFFFLEAYQLLIQEINRYISS